MADPPKFDTDILDSPPSDFEIFGKKDAARKRDRLLTVDNYEKIVSHHAWGFKYTIPSGKKKEGSFALLKRIFFNQQPHLRAKSWQAFILGDCDAGPGLLEPRYNAPQVTLNNQNGARTGTTAVTRVNTNPRIPSNSSHSQEKRSSAISQNHSTLAQMRPYPLQQTAMSSSLRASPATQRLPSYSSGVQTSNQRSPELANNFPNSLLSSTNILPTYPDSMFSGLPDMDMSMGMNSSNVGGGVASEITEYSAKQPTVFNTFQQAIVEAVEREMLRMAYRGLERHPLAFPIGICPTLIATSAEDFSNPPREFPGALRVRLTRDVSGLESRFDPNGALYSYRGRGPISTNNSSSVDCTIVAGKLLDAGSTISDRREEQDWEATLAPVERAFIEATTIKWDGFSKNSGDQARKHFWTLLNGRINHHNLTYLDRQFCIDERLPPTVIWEFCTASFQQFQFRYEEGFAACPCQNIEEVTNRPIDISSIEPRFEESDTLGVTMQVLLNRFFERCEPTICPACSDPRSVTIKSFGELPLRLVVKPDQRALLCQHTSKNISFKYSNLQNEEMVATYRWLGGVYWLTPPGQPGRYAVFWTDDKRGEITTGNVCMYDGTQNSGVIVGNIPPANPEERVPGEWRAPGSIQLLFYERVINPSLDTLTTARDAVNNMIRAVDRKELILENHRQWQRTGDPSDVEHPQREFLYGSASTSESGPDGRDLVEEWVHGTMPSIVHGNLMYLPNNPPWTEGGQYQCAQEPQTLQLQNQSFMQPYTQSQIQMHHYSQPQVQPWTQPQPQPLQLQNQPFTQPYTHSQIQMQYYPPPQPRPHLQPQAQPQPQLQAQPQPQPQAQPQAQRQRQLQSQMGLQNPQTPQAQIGPFVNELETDNVGLAKELHHYLSPDGHGSSTPQNPQPPSVGQAPNADSPLQPFSDTTVQQSTKRPQYVSLTEEGINPLWTRKDSDLPLHVKSKDKRQRSLPSNNCQGSDSSPLLKKQRHT